MNPGIAEGKSAAVDAKLKAGKRVYLISEIDSTMKVTEFGEFEAALKKQALLW